MTLRDNRAEAQAKPLYTSALASDFNQALRQSLTKALVRYYPPADDIPPDLRELVARLEQRQAD